MMDVEEKNKGIPVRFRIDKIIIGLIVVVSLSIAIKVGVDIYLDFEIDNTAQAEIVVSIKSSTGQVFECKRTGEYQITIIDGVYNSYPDGRDGQWRTNIAIFRNREVEYDNAGIPIGDASVGNWQDVVPNVTKDRAQELAIGAQTSISCDEGQYLRFVIVDEAPSYSDNIGEDMNLRIERVTN